MENFTKFKRDPDTGLLTDNIQYVFNDDGSVNWRKMLKPNHLYLNIGNRADKGYADKVSKLEDKYKKKLSEIKVEEADDRDLTILLEGVRFLMFLRGFTSDKRKVDSVVYDPHYQVVASCTVTSEITWIPNFETCGLAVTSTDQAGASLGNCYNFAQRYTEAIASNRALGRNVKNFLRIPIVFKDEIGPDGDLKPIHNEEVTTPSGNQPEDLIEQRVKADWNLTFDQFKKVITAKYKDPAKNPDYAKLEKNPEEWVAYNTIPRNDIFLLLGVLKKAKDEKKK